MKMSLPKAKNIFLIFFILSLGLHLLMLISLFSEPFALEHPVSLTGSRSHPQEKAEIKGFLDSFFHDTDRVPRGLDFFSIYQAGYNFSEGISVYYGIRKHKFGDRYLVVPYFSGFRYLPIYAYSYGYLLTMLEPWNAYWTWICFVELLLLFNVFLVFIFLKNHNLKLLVSGMWLAYSPYYIELHIGQQSMVTVTLLHLAGILHLRKNYLTRDLTYISSVIWKLNTIIFLPILIKFRRWYSLGFLLILIFLVSTPYFMLVPGSFSEFFSYFHAKFIAIGPSSFGFWAFASSLMQKVNMPNATIRMVLVIWTLIILTISSLTTLLPKKTSFTYLLCIWLCTYFLTYQYVWEHHYVMLLPVFSLLMLYEPSGIWVAIWLLCAVPTPYFFFNVESLKMPQLNWSLSMEFLYHGIKILPVLVLYLLLIIRLWSSKYDKDELKTLSLDVIIKKLIS